MVKPSNVKTNEIVDDIEETTEYFEYEDEFKNSLDIFALSLDDNVMKLIVSLDPPNTESEHIVDDGSGSYIISTTGGVLLGKMSFQLLSDEFDISGFSLVEDASSSPKTGIKISINTKTYYEAQSTFRFTDATASKDAYLSNIIVSSGIKNDDINLATYKEYSLNPNFDKEVYDYNLELLEYIDSLDITVSQSDANSNMKIWVPKRDSDNKLIFDSGGTTIIYEEKDLEDGVPMSVVLNKLGEPDTVIKIEVTAEDGKTKNTYNLVINRPYGTIKGRIIYDTIEDNENPDINKTTDLNFYLNGKFDWEQLLDIFGEVYESPLTYDDLDLIEKFKTDKSNADGSFEVYIIPGTYDLQIDKSGFLDYIVTGITVKEGDIIDLEDKTIIAGDVNRDRSCRT